ncbi:FAD-dependent oxidoreductase [Pseudomaricurvus sp. HS19]|uniref:FAD-dependent oxidoreductase n=1 Tax=Pseudomaricurvus sp. HS19 TaxID=2692626 RepID=UPI001369FEB4|nr:FAD-dependent oxidoreductase [Pseudomaricurvus sp. HS19]MYM64560.1 FAD-dependent oxidoreductase [Pseudomaricurvus sp. HS19]
MSLAYQPESGSGALAGEQQWQPVADGGRVLVIGSGPVGMRFVDELLRRRPHALVEVFGNEPYNPYNRVQLSSLLAGEADPLSLDIPLPDVQRNPGFRFTSCAIRAIDTDNKQVTDALGQVHPFDQLVIATGARAHVPNIEGTQQSGVYTFRNMKDAQALYSRVARARSVVVVGGGLLGIEAAKGLSRLNTRVTLIQQGPRLMNRQLDEGAAALLQHGVMSRGIHVITDSGVREILGDGRVTAIRTRDGETIDCDTVLLCAGIRPNLELAREARIRVAGGIVVDDRLQTSADGVYAIGECCEHRGLTYGLVAPGLEQAAVLAENLAGGSACYQGSSSVSRLKVLGEEVVSVGEVADLPQRPHQHEIRYRFAAAKHGYRKLVVHRGRLIGAVGFGSWPQFNRVQEACKSARRIWPWQWLLFWITGRLWLGQGSESVARWPLTAVVCQCNQVSVGALRRATDEGCNTVAALGKATRAGTVCGSCKPLLAQLIGGAVEKAKGAWALLGASLAALLAVIAVIGLPEAPIAVSVQTQGWFESVWSDKGWKQVTGFSLLGMVTVGLLMSLRKRLQWEWMGAFFGWRLLHGVLGMSCALLLIFHTGFHLGENLNRLLMLTFLAVLLLGAGAGAVVSLAHRLPPASAAAVQKTWNWLHLLVSWPLPVLLIVHIITVYYF